MGHPLYLRGGVCKPLDMRQIGMTDLTLPLSGVPSGELEMDSLAKRGSTPKGGGRMILTFPGHQ